VGRSLLNGLTSIPHFVGANAGILAEKKSGGERKVRDMAVLAQLGESKFFTRQIPSTKGIKQLKKELRAGLVTFFT